MHRNTTLALVCAAVLAVLFGLFLSSRGDQPAIEYVAEPAPTHVVPAPTIEAAPTAAAEPRSVAVPETTREESVAASAPPATSARCIVFGRLLDENGAPLVGAEVRLYGYKVWAEGLEVPRLSGRMEFRGFEVATGSAGDFRIGAPVPTVARTVLSIHPDRFHDSVTLYFAEAGDRMLPPIDAGERDLGELRVARTGALIGRVLDSEGRPLADVYMDIGETRVTTLGRNAETGADGSYVIAHAPVGTYGVSTKAKEYLSHFEEGIRVEAGRDTLVPDIVLVRAPTLEGTVVDENGRPVAGARLWGWPVGSGGGSGAGGRSEPNGRFVIPLPQTDPYTLSAQLDGYLTWGNEHDQSVTYAPGRHDIEVVLRSLPRTRFTVVDAESGTPIERFGLSILADNGSSSPRMVSTEKRPPPQSVHAGGVAEATARAGIDQCIVAADGYALAAVDVEYDIPDVPAQTVRMQRGAGLRGRVLRDGTAIADVQVESVELISLALDAEGNPDPGRHVSQGNTRRATRTDVEGRFELSGLDSGDHRLTVRPATGAPLVLAPVKVRAKKSTDLGDLNLLAGATIVGELLLPPGLDPSGLAVVLDDWRDGVKALADASGHFRFEDVPAGVRFLAHAERAGVLAEGVPTRVEVAAGETRTVTLDARDRAMCAVELRIDLGGISPLGVQVQVLPADDSAEQEMLGVCDASGHVRGAVRAFGAARVGVFLPGGLGLVQHPDVVLGLRPLGHVEAAVRFEFAQIELRTSIDSPRDGRIQVQLEPRDPEHSPRTIWLEFVDGVAKDRSSTITARPKGLWVGGIPSGEYTLTLEWIDAQAKDVPTDLGGGRVRHGPEPYHRATVVIDLVAGKTLELDL
jgi:protocatechuate 3,4-dioxygenase beta subunit